MPARSSYSSLACLAVTFLAALSGCGGGVTTVSLSGQVTYAGEAVDLGTIRFEPLDGKGATAEFPIQAGRYVGEVTPGKKKVVIQGKRQTGVTQPGGPTGPSIPAYEDFVPEKYNSASKLEVDVTTSKPDADFLLEK